MKQMKFFRPLTFLFIGLIVLNSCAPEDPDEPTSLSTLGLVKTADINDENEDGFAEIGETITYTFTVTNTGTTTISQLVINDVRISVSDLSLTPSELAPEATGTATVDYQITFADLVEGEISNQAEVSGIDSNGDMVTDLSDPESNYTNGETLTIYDSEITFENGYFVVNEGLFGSGNASLTFVHDDGSILQNAYEYVNEEVIGDVLQCMYIHGDNAYLVVNNSHKIIVVNRYTMEKITVIDDVEVYNPRYMVVYNGFGYVSNWGVGADPNDDTILKINLATNEVDATIPVGFTPNKMQVVGNKLYVAIQGWYPDIENKVDVIDLTTNTVVQTIDVGDYPESMIVKNNDLYVLASGNWGVSGGEITVIDTNTDVVTDSFNFAVDENPSSLIDDGTDFYYSLNGGVYKWDGINALPTTSESGLEGNYYGMTSKDGLLYTLDAGDYASEGTLNVFDLSTNTATQTVTTGIVPNSVVFN